MSGSIGLGHAARDLAIADELRRLDPGAEIDWLAGAPARLLIEDAGERVLPEAAAFQETGFAEDDADGFSLNIVWHVAHAAGAWNTCHQDHASSRRPGFGNRAQGDSSPTPGVEHRLPPQPAGGAAA